MKDPSKKFAKETDHCSEEINQQIIFSPKQHFVIFVSSFRETRNKMIDFNSKGPQ